MFAASRPRAARPRQRVATTLLGAHLALALVFAFALPMLAFAQPGLGDLVGRWLGPALGDTGQCGAAYAEFMFTADGQFAYVQNTEACGGIDGGGVYSIDGQSIHVHFDHCSTCAVYGTPPDVVESYRMPDRDTLMLCDVRCYTFRRE